MEECEEPKSRGPSQRPNLVKTPGWIHRPQDSLIDCVEMRPAAHAKDVWLRGRGRAPFRAGSRQDQACVPGSPQPGARGRREYPKRKEKKMDEALTAVQILFYLLGGLGLFFLGIGALWYVDTYKKKG